MNSQNRNDYDEARALKLLSQGNREGFKMIYDRYARGIYASGLKMLQSRELAQDLVQDVFTAVLKNPAPFCNADNLAPYLFNVAKYSCLKKLKELSREHEAKKEYLFRKETSTRSLDDLIHEKEYAELVQEAVEKLPPQQKQVFIMVREKGLTHEATATELHLSPLTVNRHLGLAVKSIHDHVLRHIASLIVAGSFLF